MRKAVLGFIIITLVLMGIPLWVFWGFSGVKDNKGDGPLIRVLDKISGKVEAIPLEEYLVGVVAAEMPANFELEALKAQAVAARTYTAKRMFMYGAKPADGHRGAEICTAPIHCQAWESTEQLKEKWGAVKYYLYIEKIKKAVRLTEGQVITYNKALIDPVYHGSCGGKGTENAENVWQFPVPYLRGVDCNLDYRAKDQVYFREFNISELMAMAENISGKQGIGTTDAKSVAGKAGLIMTAVEKSPAGRIKKARLYGATISGTKLREMLGMTSTYLSCEVNGDKVRFTSTGKGHAVGMCQYGANGMAKEGKSYRDIVLHYYSGAQIEKLKY